MRTEVHVSRHNHNTNLSNARTRINSKNKNISSSCKLKKAPPKASSTKANNLRTTVLIATISIATIMNTSYYSSLLRLRIQQPFAVKCDAFFLNSPTKKKSLPSNTVSSANQYCTAFHPQHQYRCRPQPYHYYHDKNKVYIQRTSSRFLSSKAEDDAIQTPPQTSSPLPNNESQTEQLIHRAEGLCAVYKPINWTSQDVVSYIRGMLERDARNRGITLAKRRSRRSKKKIKVGHGGTLDPLAEGVLVLGIGPVGTKSLTKYLSGSKGYVAKGKFGFETNTLDMEGNVTKSESYDHISHEEVERSLEKFRGKIMQVPPLFSAIRKNGKRLYEQARIEGKVEEDIVIDPREVEIYQLEYVPDDGGGDHSDQGDAEQGGLPSFGLTVQCGGGTYIRSLIRDIGYEVGSVATMTNLIRTKQGPFTLDNAMPKDEWNADTIYAAVEKFNAELSSDNDDDNTGGKEYNSEVAS